MDNKEIISLFENKKIDEMLDALESLSPHEISVFDKEFFSWIEKNCDLSESDDSPIYYVKLQMTKKQHDKFKYLHSSEWARLYIMKKDESTLTDQDMSDLRAADF